MARIKDLKGLTDSGYWDSIWKKVKKLPAVNTKTSFVDKQISTIIQKEIIDKPNVKICQLGCGTGKWLKFLVENITKISEIWGLDFAPSAVELSIKNLKSTKTNIPFHVISGDILSLPAPFNGKTFDFIFSIGVFEHFFNWEEVIKLSSLCLKPGGKMLTVIPNLEGLNGLIMKRFNPQSYARHIVISPEELERAYKKQDLVM